MFTGIVQAMGKIEAIEPQDRDMRIFLSCGELETADFKRGDSIAVNGVCLTIADICDAGIKVDVSEETLLCTTLSGIQRGDSVNLEKALLPSTPLGGHFVSGHVDGVGIVDDIRDEGRSVCLRIAVPVQLAKYIAPKGSISVDGVSLTVNRIKGDKFDVNIIPHTRAVTILGEYTAGTRVNIEVDIIARYIERLLNAGHQQQSESTIPRAFLAEHGYINKPGSNSEA
jgi:riboflavin synthase